MKMLGSMRKSFDLCMRPGELMDGVKLAEKCPKTRFILDHCGNLSVTNTDDALRKSWAAGIKAAAGLENMVCKISGIIVTTKKGEWTPADLADNINYCLDAFGEDRLLFAGDWPVCTLRASFAEWLSALKEIVRDRPIAFQRKLFHDNAVKLYGLS
jgi:predicted TIM-barrel fold metal-dependent hydrolase